MNEQALLKKALELSFANAALVDTAAALDRELVRLQCYEGLDESKALYEWNYQKQLLSIQVQMNRQDPDALTRSLFGSPRPGTGGRGRRTAAAGPR